MAHVPRIDPAASPATVKPTLDAIKGAFGVVPDMFKAVANSPGVKPKARGLNHVPGPGTRPCRSIDGD